MTAVNVIGSAGGLVDRAVEAYERKLEEMLALKPEQILAVRVDVRKAAIAGLRLADACNDHHIKEKLAVTVPGFATGGAVEALRDVALAAYEAGERMEEATAGRNSKRLPAELVARGREVRERMLPVVRHNLAGLPEAADKLAAIVGGNGHVDLTSDLKRLAFLYERFADEVRGDKYYRSEDRVVALATAQEMLELLGQFGEGDYKRAVEMQARAYTLLSTAYAEVRATLMYACRDTPDVEEVFGSLVKVSRRAASSSSADPGASEETAAPAGEVTSVA